MWVLSLLLEMENYNVYLHYGQKEKDPFYVGASKGLDRAYNFTNRSHEWLDLYNKYNQQIRVAVIFVDDDKQALKLETELIEKYEGHLCNKTNAVLLPRPPALLPKADKVLKIMADNIKLARLRRGLSAAQVAERAGISRPTLWSIEKGDASVSITCILNVLFVMNLHEEIARIAFDDPIGRKIQDVNLLS